jgi:acetyl esterase/lipase
VSAAGGAQTWSTELRERLARAVTSSHSPLFLFQAENDCSVAPTEDLAEAMREAGKPSVVKIYPGFGSSAADGHTFAWRGSAIWAPDAFRFLDAQCP